MKQTFTLIALLLSLACLSQHKIYLKADHIKGESKDKAHLEWIDAFAFAGGATNTGFPQHGSGAGTGKANVSDYSLTICLDKSVVGLRQALFLGTLFKKVEIDVAKVVQGAETVYIKILLENVLITSLQEGGSIGEDKLTLNVSFSFTKYTYTYTPINPNGSTGSPVSFTWNMATNNTN